MEIDDKILQEISILIENTKFLDKKFFENIVLILKKVEYCCFHRVKLVFETFNKPASSYTKKEELQVNPDYLYYFSVDWVNKNFPQENSETKEIILKYFAVFIILHELFHFDQYYTSIYGGRYKETEVLYYNIFKFFPGQSNYEKFKENYAKFAREFCHERNANLGACFYLIKIAPKALANKLEEMYLEYFIMNYNFEGKRETPARKTFEMMGKYYFADSYFSEKFYTPKKERFLHGLDISLGEFNDIIVPIRTCEDLHSTYEELQLKLNK